MQRTMCMQCIAVSYFFRSFCTARSLALRIYCFNKVVIAVLSRPCCWCCCHCVLLRCKYNPFVCIFRSTFSCSDFSLFILCVCAALRRSFFVDICVAHHFHCFACSAPHTARSRIRTSHGPGNTRQKLLRRACNWDTPTNTQIRHHNQSTRTITACDEPN